MKKKKISIILSFIVLIQIMTMNPVITEAAGSISVSTSKAVVGDTVTITVNYSSNTNTTFNFKIKSENSSVISLNEQIFDTGGITGTKSGSKSFYVKAKSVGTANILIYENDSISVETKELIPVSGSNSIEVITAPTAPEPTAPEPTAPEPSKPTPPPVKTPEQIAKEKEEARIAQEAADKKAAEDKLAAEKVAEEAALALKQSTPMLSSLQVISKSDKRSDAVLIEFNPQVDEFALEYTLPKRITDFELALVPTEEGVTLDYETSHSLGDAESKEITITATGNDITQTFVLTVKKDLTEDPTLMVENKSVVVYSDKILDEVLTKHGFKAESYHLNDLISSYFSYKDLKVQLLVDEESNARWFLLNDEMVPTYEVVILVAEGKEPIFVYDTDDLDLVDKVLYGAPYKSKTFEIDPEIHDVDSGLKFKDTYKSWDYEVGEVVLGFTDSISEGLIYFDAETDATRAVIAFDQESSATRTVAIASSVGLVTVSGYVVATTLMNIRNSIK